MAISLSLLLGLASCYDNDPNYPPEPEISFLNVGEVSFDGVDNDVTIYLTLQDGDGDVGTPEGESPSCRADGNFCDYTTFNRFWASSPLDRWKRSCRTSPSFSKGMAHAPSSSS